MAIVFAAQDLTLGREVAVKTLRPQFAADQTFRARFAREARASASLSHPNIIDVHDVGEEENIPYLVMELVRGQTLKAIIAAEAPFHATDVAELLGQVGAALDYAHTHGYVHRDVKPGNILIDELGRARVVDFGIAKGVADHDLTEIGGGIGTAGYISPEQASGLMATPASDLYSVGVIAYEMLTGSLPFRADSAVGLAVQHVQDDAAPPSRLRPGISPAIDAVVLRALDKDPTKRWQTVSAFASALRDGRAAPLRPFSTQSGDQDSGKQSTSLIPTIAAIVLVLGALAGLLWFGSTLRTPQPASPTAAVIVPSDPIITGAVEEVAPAPTLASTEQQAPTPLATQPPIVPGTGPQDVATNTVLIPVPDLQGLSIADANRSLLPLGLRVAMGQPTFSDTFRLNTVVSQDPPAGLRVPEGTVIHVSLSRGKSPFGNDTQP